MMFNNDTSCDTEDWNNTAEHSALNHRNKSYFKIITHKKAHLILI